jgi:hypothetical protein
MEKLVLETRLVGEKKKKKLAADAKTQVTFPFFNNIEISAVVVYLYLYFQ